MHRKEIDLAELIQNYPSATISVQLTDLNIFAKRLIKATRDEYENEIAQRLNARSEVYLTTDTVKQTVKVSESTLWRWAKAGLLVPVMVGGQKRYRQSDIDRIVQNGLCHQDVAGVATM